MSDIQYSNQEAEGPSLPRIYSPHVHVNHELSSPRADKALLCHASHNSEVSGTMAHTRHSSGSSGPQAALHGELDQIGSSSDEVKVEETVQESPVSLAVVSTNHSAFFMASPHNLHAHCDPEDQTVAASPRLPSRHTASIPKGSSSELDLVPVPCINVEDNEDGYIFERPNCSRRRRELDEEETEHRPSKRVRLQTPDDLETSSRSKSSSDLHIKYSCGRRTRGSTRYN
ncbi:hypothetical protein CPB86DRAFT_875864 [Serendipita vermifera]|nr:hypothetical protein CPB86DRAFT_875864 [Serendipita vermifera]